MITEYNKFLDFFRKKLTQMPHQIKKEENSSDIIFYKSKIDDVEDTLVDLSGRRYTIDVRIEPLNIDDFIPQLRRDRDLEATKNIEYIEITIVKT